MKNYNVEAEGGETIIRNEFGDIAIVPAHYNVKELLDKPWAIDQIVQDLPTASAYAVTGTILPEEDNVPSKGDNGSNDAGMALKRSYGYQVNRPGMFSTEEIFNKLM
jgi:hypothetical protein